jgi:hypothetical protein
MIAAKGCEPSDSASSIAAAALGLAGAVLTGGLAAAACQLLHAGPAWPGLTGCLAAFGYLGWRPAWTRPPARPRASRLAGRGSGNAGRAWASWRPRR